MRPHEVEPSRYRGGVETLDVKYDLIILFRWLSFNCLCGHMKWSHGFLLGTNS